MYLKHKQNRQEQINEENDTTQRRAKFVTKILNRLWKNNAFIIKEKISIHSYNQRVAKEQITY